MYSLTVVAADPDYDLDDVMELTTAEQVAAVGNLARFRLLGVLAVRAATVSQLAVELELLKGSVSHHLKVLSGAGMVRVVRTAKVRGGTERYWGRVARVFDVVAANPAHDRRGMVLRTVAQDLDAAPADADQQLVITRLRLGAGAYQRLREQVAALVATAEADQDPGAPVANLTIALYRTAAPARTDADADADAGATAPDADDSAP